MTADGQGDRLTESERKALVRWLHNEGDGGIWESFDRENAEQFVAVFAESTWLERILRDRATATNEETT